MHSNGNSVEPYFMSDAAAPSDNKWTSSPQASPHLVAGEKTKTFVIIGDSLSASSITPMPNPPLYAPVNAKCQMFNVWDGGVYRASDPLVGCGMRYPNVQHWATRMVDRMVTDGLVDRGVIAAIAVAGSTATDWAGVLNHRITTCGRRLQSVGLAETAIVHICLGTNDCGIDWRDGTAIHVPAYQAHIAAVIATCVAAGLTGPILLGRATWVNKNGYGELAPGTATVVAALAALTDNVTTFSGANFNTLDNSYRQDGVHPNFTTGLDAFASLTRAAVTPFL